MANTRNQVAPPHGPHPHLHPRLLLGQKQLTIAERLAGIVMAAILEMTIVIAITVADAEGYKENKTTPIANECN